MTTGNVILYRKIFDVKTAEMKIQTLKKNTQVKKHTH